MKRLFSSPESAEMGLLKSRLEETGIPCLLRNEQISQAIPATAFSAELWIANDEDYPRAVDLCEVWRHPSPEARPAWTCHNCGEKLEGQFSACWKCGSNRVGDASIEPEDLSRLEGEGGLEAPELATELIEVAHKNAIGRRPPWAAHPTNQKKMA